MNSMQSITFWASFVSVVTAFLCVCALISVCTGAVFQGSVRGLLAGELTGSIIAGLFGIMLLAISTTILTSVLFRVICNRLKIEVAPVSKLRVFCMVSSFVFNFVSAVIGYAFATVLPSILVALSLTAFIMLHCFLICCFVLGKNK